MIAHISDAFERDSIAEYPVIRVSASSFDYEDADRVYRIHAAYDAERVYSAAVAVPVKPRA